MTYRDTGDKFIIYCDFEVKLIIIIIIINKFFSSTFVTDNHILSVAKNYRRILPEVKPKFNAETVTLALQKLKPTFASDPSGICSFFLKSIGNSIIEPLSSIFEVSYVTGQLPKQWLEAVVVPIHKKGSQTSVENYRPISLCSVIGKLMESIINSFIVNHLSEHKLLCSQQFGFQKSKSCALQLVDSLNCWTILLDQKKSVDVVYIDFQKAFDSVVHSKLITKLENFGFSATFSNWLKSFLSNRIQKVIINGVLSDSTSVISGVPQGSVLGPTLFLIFINDLVNQVKFSEIRLFADDLKVFTTSEKGDFLQQDLNSIVSWTKAWQLPIAYRKCNVLYLGRSNPKNSYTIGDVTLEDAGNGCRDLGVFINSNLSSSVHCNNIVSKASRISALIHRTFVSKDPELKLRAFKAYVRPILEYATTAWSPHLMKDITNVERVQRRFTKKILGKTELTYSERLNLLKLDSLETRRIHFDAILAYQIIQQNILPFKNFYTYSTGVTRSALNSDLCINKFRLDCRKFSFSSRSLKIWNFLPLNVRKSANISIFKKNLYKIDFSPFIHGRV